MATAAGSGGGGVHQGYIGAASGGNPTITKYRAVEQVTDDNTVQQTSTLGNRSIGVVQESATATDLTNLRVLDVQITGVTIIELAGTIARNTPVRSDANGRAVVLPGATANQEQLGIILQSGVAGDWVKMLLTIGVPRTTP